MHKVFVCYHHKNDQWYKNELISWAEKNQVFIDGSVGLGEIPEDWDDQKVREHIRDEYLRDTTVTIVLVGTETQYRKHVDWEIYSSMHDGKKNKKSGIIVILLPSVKSDYYTCGFGNEKTAIYPEQQSWTSITERTEFERRYPYMPARIIDNLLKVGVNISVINWDKLNVENLRLMIDNAYDNRAKQDYDMSRPMRERNYNKQGQGTMKRKVFYSFHYAKDSWRAGQVRNIGVVEGDEPLTSNKWEEVKQKGDASILKWIQCW